MASIKHFKVWLEVGNLSVSPKCRINGKIRKECVKDSLPDTYSSG